MRPVLHKAEPKELTLYLAPLQHHAKPVRPILPAPSTEPTPERSNTITLPPVPQTLHPQTDVMRAIGKELACGAGSYENLSPSEREVCRRTPWHFKKDTHGIIVLERVPLPEPPTTGAEAADHALLTADPCAGAKAARTECIHKTPVWKLVR